MESELWGKIAAGRRISVDDAQSLYDSPDLIGLGWMAKQVKEKRYGPNAFYVLNQKLEPSNLCVLSCQFCDFGVRPGDPKAYEWTVEEMIEKCRGEIREIHITGAMPPEWKFEHYLRIVEALHQAYPRVGIKAYTAVEIEWMARISKQSVEDVLIRLKEAGLTALPGGGAEVFSERVRNKLFPLKIGANEWLAVHRTAHRLGIPSNATMLYGHIETPEERWRHLELLRTLQDESLQSRHPRVSGDPSGTLDSRPPQGPSGGPPSCVEGRFRGNDVGAATGFMSFIPLRFHPGATGLDGPPSSVIDDLKLLAISRLFLDNVPHIKAYWVALGEETASLALHWGADDIDGTVGGERIMHDAGAVTPAQLTRERLERLIREAGGVPVERDALYNEIDRTLAPSEAVV
jgi:aminodeoxyfutalosine synthase